jgi:hypothetical protein
MAKATGAMSPRSAAFSFSRIHKCKIHPGIGIARVGNSPDEDFIGPEAPYDPDRIVVPDGGFKDVDGRIKRQAARFRIFAYDRAGRNLGEIPIGGEDGFKAGRAAQVVWKVHLKNKKGAWYKFGVTPKELRNADVGVKGAQRPDSRLSLVIDPGPRCIDGEGSPVEGPGIPKDLKFGSGRFQDTIVPLGQLRVDPDGRLLVLGGLGCSGSTKLDNPIGANPCMEDFWANNDNWYDDISDGPVTATVTLPGGRQLVVDQPKEAAWVVVGPPKFAPGLQSLVTLYDVIRQVAVDQKWIRDDRGVTYYRDIYPILRRAAGFAWINKEAQRGHGYDKRGDFSTPTGGVQPDKSKAANAPGRTRVTDAILKSHILSKPDQQKEHRERIFRRMRNPLLDDTHAADQANSRFMPLLSGDDGDRTEGEPRTWLSILPSQYRKFELWKDGKFTPGEKPRYPSLEQIKDRDQQVEALQRGALEPCVGGAFFPGIEMPGTVRDKDLYTDAFRINSKKYGPGDITKDMCVPWQADFFDCKETWWPAARPDDVIPEDVFEEAQKAWRPGQPRLSEGLESRVKWARGLGVTTLFRRPWHSPADATDDPRDSERRGCDDMVRYWHELGFVLPRKTVWKGKNLADVEIVHVETERRPHAGMDVRELFNCLLNLEENRSCLPKVREFVDNVLEASRQMQLTANSFAFMDNIRPFTYDESVFDARMGDIYDDCADFAFTETVNGERVEYDPCDINQNPYFHTRENVIERIRQLTPFNFLDGSWLRNIHRVGPVDEVNSILFTILKEELGDGVPSQNHANIYRDLCHSFGFYPPEMNTTAFVRDPVFLDCAFDSPAFQLGISEFSSGYYPEIIGMSLWLEWTVMELHRIAAIVERVGLSPHFYRMHIAIDNAASGHGAEIIRAVKLYLSQIRIEGGDKAVQEHWKRIWDGYVAFAYTFVIVIKQVIRIIQTPLNKQERLVRLIIEKAPYGQYNHGARTLGENTISSWFSDPAGFLQALQDNGYIVPGKPDQSPFFKLLEFRGGPMYHVFTEDEIALWRDWTWELGEERGSVQALKDRLSLSNPEFAKAVSKEKLRDWKAGADDHRISLWLKIATAEFEKAGMTPKRPNAANRRKYIDGITEWIDKRFSTWIGWGMIRAVTYVAAQRWQSVEGLPYKLRDSVTEKELSIAEWFKLIREAPNSAVPAHAMLKALGDGTKNKVVIDSLFGGQNPLWHAFNIGIPGNDRRVALDTARAWVKAGRWLPDKVSEGQVKALRLDSSLQEEETHPTGLAMGFGTVH